MKMKQKRQLEKNPPYMHTCSCTDREEFLTELPTAAYCVNPRYYKRNGDSWVDITDDVLMDYDGFKHTLRKDEE